ncbi:MAG TPA: EamA family transporter [Acidimicrobiales bacterium]|nr:EamA family transporter [Acidimicrobiales bacterium]
MDRRGWLLFGAMGVIWGIPYLLIRVSVRELTPGTLVFLRTAPAALALLPLAFRRGLIRPLVERWPWVVLYTTVELAVPWGLLSSAERRIPSSLAALLVATVPLMGVVVGWRSTRFDRRTVSGLVVGLVGVALLVGVDVRGASWAALGQIAVTAFGYACGPLIVSRRFSDLPALGLVAVSLALTAVAYAPWGLSHLPPRVSLEVAGSVATLAVVCTAVAFLLFFALIGAIGPVRATMITYVNPAVALLLGIALLGERFTVGMGFGLPLVLAGVALTSERSRLPRAAPGRSRRRAGRP